MPYYSEMFSEMRFWEMEEKGDGGLKKKAIVYKCSPNQFLLYNHITLVWDSA
jgi:hypothetical protein